MNVSSKEYVYVEISCYDYFVWWVMFTKGFDLVFEVWYEM